MLQNETLTGTITLAQAEAKLQEVTVRSKANESQEVLPEEGFDGFSKVNVQQTPLTTITITPSSSKQTINASDHDAQGFSQVVCKSCYPLNTSGNTLNGVTIPEMNIVCSASITAVANNAFKDNPILKSFSGSNVVTVGNNAFSNSSIQTVSLPSATTIGDSAFENCRKLASVNLPSVTTIGEGTFLGNNLLTSINLPSVTTLSRHSLAGDRLTDAYFGYDGVVTFSGGPFVHDAQSAIRVHVRASQLSAYQSNQSWQDYIDALAEDGLTLTIVGDYA